MIDQEMACAAADRMSPMKFYPSDPAARGEIAFSLARFVSTPAQLEWLVRTMIDRVGEWPGTRELRAVFCTRFKPKDGIEVDSSLGGFTAGDSERAYLEQHHEQKRLDKKSTMLAITGKL